MERGTLEALFRARGQRFGAPQIVIVVANDETVARYKSWPLPRRHYAELVRRLKHVGAKTVAFDLLFSESSPSASDDAALVRACREAGNVVQGCAFHVEGLYNPSLPASATGLGGRFDPRFALSDNRSTLALPSAVWVSAPLPALRETTPFLGHLNVHPRRDGSLRYVPYAIRFRDGIYPSLSLAAAAHFLGVKARDIQVTPREVLIAGRHLPLEEDGETGINWRGGTGTFPSYPLSQVLDGKVPSEVFKDKIVLVGATAAGSFEYRSTPFSSVQPAIEVQANALDNALMNRPLRFADARTRFLLLMLFAAITGALIAPRHDTGGTIALLCLAGVLWALALWLLSSRDFYLPVGAPLLAAALTYALAMATNYRHEWETNFRADAAASALARGGALMAEGRDRARLQTVIRATARDALRASEIFMIRGDTDDPTLQALLQQLSTRRRAVLYPFARRPSASEKPFAPDAALADLLVASAERFQMPNGSTPTSTIVAAPLPGANSKPDEFRPSVRGGGALVAVGSREGRAFSFRDAILLETLAEQAALAIENLEYYELLQGRVELANSDLRNAYGVLAEQSAKFMAAVESMDDALVICDADGNAVFVNGGASPTLRGATPELGQNVPEVLRAHGLDVVAALFDCLTLNKFEEECEPVRCEEIVSGTASEDGNKEQRTLAAQLTPLVSDGISAAGERNIGAMLIVADVTAQRELDQMKTDFVSFVAHELRSPLGAILGYASLLQQYSERADPAMRDEMTGSIVRQCHRLNRMIGDLLDVSRFEAGRTLDLRHEKVELRGLAEKVLDAQRAALNNPKISLRLECEEPVISVWGDPDRIEQVLINLLSNAAKYSPDGGEVVLSFEEAEGQVLIRVSDKGMGMTREQVENLFQKFYRTPDARARGIKGTGLGLFLVKNLVEAHRGKISVESEVGRGTTFSVWLPQRGAEASDDGQPFSDKMLLAP